MMVLRRGDSGLRVWGRGHSFLCLIYFGLGVWLRRAKGYEAFEYFQVHGLLNTKIVLFVPSEIT